MRKVARNHTRKIADIRANYTVITSAKDGKDHSEHAAVVWGLIDEGADWRLYDMQDGTYGVGREREDRSVFIAFILSTPEQAASVSEQAASVSEQDAPATEEPAAPAESIWEGYRLDAEQLAATREKVEKINNRAAARGLAGRLTVEARQCRKTVTRGGFEVEEIYYLVKISGDAPAMPDWEFVATLDWDAHAGLIVRTVPGIESIKRDGLVEAACAHCQTNVRRYKTYVIRHKATGEEMQVGSTCIKDFLGWTASVATLEKGSEGFFADLGEYIPEYTPRDVVAVAWASIQVHGWVPKSQYWKRATVADVEDILYPPTKGEAVQLARELEQELRPYIEQSRERADEIVEFILSDAFPGDSDYALNLKALCAADRVSYRYLGMVASAPAAWARHQERKIAREEEAKVSAASQHVGTVGDRTVFTVTVERVNYYQTRFGTSALVRMHDEEGNILKWWSSSDDIEKYVGKTVRIKATVKQHDTYKGVHETIVSRAAFLD